MFEDKLIRETPYGRLVEHGHRGKALITPDGDRFLKGHFSSVSALDSWTFDAFAVLYDDLKRYLSKFPLNDQELLVKLNACYPHDLGMILELAALAEIQKQMAEKDLSDKPYIFVPHKLYLATSGFSYLLTDWADGEAINRIPLEKFFDIKDAALQL